MSNKGLSVEEKEELEDLLEKDREDLSDGEVTSLMKLKIRDRFDKPEWLLFFEIPQPKKSDGVGQGYKRCDAIAINSYPSRDYKMVGFEFKASRSDWKKEKRDGGKNDFFVGQCDEWYVVGGRKGIIQKEEVPSGWGFMEVKPSGQIWKIRESDLSERQDNPVSTGFLIRMIKKAYESAEWTDRDIRIAKRKGYKEAENEKSSGVNDFELKQMKRKAEKFKNIEKKFKDASDDDSYFSLTDDEIENMVQAREFLKELNEDDYFSMAGSFEDLMEDIEDLQEDVEESASKLERLKKVAES